MSTLPPVASGTLIRTDFADDARWNTVRDAAFAPDEEGFTPYQLSVVDDASFSGASPEDVLRAVPEGAQVQFVMIADATTMTDETFLVLKPTGTPDRFRTAPAAVAAIDNNLSIANMDFEEFASAIDADGVFRGF